MNYGRALKTLRGARGLSQKQVATLASLDASTMSLVESGKRAPSAGALEALSLALDVPVFLLVFAAYDETELKGINVEQAAWLSTQLMTLLRAKQKAP